MNCCDEYGNCRQGRDCPVRIERLRKIQNRHDDPVWHACIQNVTIIAIILVVVLVASLYQQALKATP